jgi:hypothetical protein
MGVHEGLSKIYGTEDAITKMAIGGGYLGAIAGALAGKSAWQQQEENRRNAELMTQAIRAQLARRNAPIYEGFRSGRIVPTPSYDYDAQPGLGGSYFPYPEMYPDRMLPMPGEMMHLASAIGADLAIYKEAGIGGLGVFGSLAKGIGGAAKSVMKMPTVQGLKGLGQGIGTGAKNFGGSLMRGAAAAPGATGRGIGSNLLQGSTWAQQKMQGGMNAAKSWGSGLMQRGQQAFVDTKQGLQLRALRGQYSLQRAGQRAEGSLTRAGNRVEGALGGDPKAYMGPTTSISPEARRAAAQTRLQGMKQKGMMGGKLETPGTPPPIEPVGTPAANNPAATSPAGQPKTTNPAPAAQTQPEPQPGQGAPYRQPPQQPPPTTQPQPPQQHATAQQPAPPALPAQPAQSGPSAQGAAGAPPPAPSPTPPPTPPAGQGQPATPPQPVAQATAGQPVASTAQAGQEGPAVSPNQQTQQGFDLGKAWNRTGLSNDRWKYKLPMLAGAGLGAYGLYRAGKGAFNWLGQESQPAQWGNSYLQPAASVNEWGVAQR